MKFKREWQVDSFTLDEYKEDPEVLVRKFDAICLPVKNKIMDRHVFNMTNQKEGENIQSYVSTLKLNATLLI